MSDLSNPNAYERMIEPTILCGEGLCELLSAIDDNPAMRRAMVLQAGLDLRAALLRLPFDASADTPVEIPAQDAIVMMDLLLRRLG